MKPKALLFDIDGTLLDTTEFILQAFEHVLLTHKLSPQARDLISKEIGKPLRECYTNLTQLKEVEDLVETHRLFQSDNLHLSTPFTHTVETLKKLKEKGYKIAAITSRGTDNVKKTLDLADISQFFDLVLTADNVTHLKPHPEGLLKALSIFQITPEEAYMIGDTEMDVVAGKNAGTRTIGASYGFHGEKIAESNPDFVIHDVKDLLIIL